ncbi:hypothetical protein VTN31DRAFT_1161 [Thermomyces dupontii]|uniref:uncharacterized protein n=1 Tax=Talaromyces thermophilus TaxID=28565 RepID=UPI003744A428
MQIPHIIPRLGINMMHPKLARIEPFDARCRRSILDGSLSQQRGPVERAHHGVYAGQHRDQLRLGSVRYVEVATLDFAVAIGIPILTFGRSMPRWEDLDDLEVLLVALGERVDDGAANLPGCAKDGDLFELGHCSSCSSEKKFCSVPALTCSYF